MSKAVTIPEVAELLFSKQRILILTHERPDGDALGSALGMQEFLRSSGIAADAYLPAPPAARYAELAGEYKHKLSPAELADYELVLLLDCATTARIAAGPELDGSSLPGLSVPPMVNVDHHFANDVNASWNLVSADSAAASEIAAQIALASGRPINVRAATLWLLGIVTDTGAFRFSNTIGRTLRIAAELLDRGAELEEIVNAAYYSKPRRQQQFESELLQSHVKTALNGEYVYAYIPDELFRKYDFDMRDGEGLIDLLREIAGTRIAALFYRKNGSFKVSLRSKDHRYPVGPVARSLGGGGHDMAAGITLNAMTEKQVEALLLEKITQLLRPEPNQETL